MQGPSEHPPSKIYHSDSQQTGYHDMPYMSVTAATDPCPTEQVLSLAALFYQKTYQRSS